MDLETDADIRDALRRFPHYADLPEDGIEPLVAHGRVRQYERDDRIWREQRRATKLTFVVDGWVKILKWTTDERHVGVGLFGEGDSVGHAAALRGAEYRTDAVAVEDTVLIHIDREPFLRAIQDDPELMRAALHDANDREFGLLRRLHDLSIAPAERRLASLLTNLAYKSGIRRSHEGQMVVEVPIALSRSDLAELINTRVETAVRKMSSFRKEGLVETQSDGFLIYDLDRLEEASAPSHPLD